MNFTKNLLKSMWMLGLLIDWMVKQLRINMISIHVHVQWPFYLLECLCWLFMEILPNLLVFKCGLKICHGQWFNGNVICMMNVYQSEQKEVILTVDSFSISSSDAPSEASPISCENWAKFGSAKSGIWPNNSWMQSL